MSLPAKYIPLLILVIFALLLGLSSNVLFPSFPSGSNPPCSIGCGSVQDHNKTSVIVEKKKVWERNVETFELDDGNVIQWVASKYYNTVLEIGKNDYIFEIVDTIPIELQNVVIYALTASDPKDEHQTEEWNDIANQKLAKDLSNLHDPKPMKIENRFRVWYNSSTWTTKVDEVIVGLGTKYDQAAIYKWYNLPNGSVIHQVMSCFDEWIPSESSNVVTVFAKHAKRY